MESDILNELFDLINEDVEEGNDGKYTVSQLINIIKNSDKYDVFLEAMADVRRDLFVDDEIHGISHNERVCIFAFVIAIQEGLDARSLRILLEAAKYHDIGRKDRTGPTGEHGLRSARIIEEKRRELVPDFNDEEVRILKALAVGHNTHDNNIESVIRENGVYDVPHAKKLLTILKDADALDRVRLKRFGKLKEEYLRTETSKKLVSVASELYEKYNETNELIKYNRVTVQRKFDSSLFGIDTYDLIEDDEYYYVFRTLNGDNEAEFDSASEEYLRTSRERAEREEKEVKYSSESVISLDEINDNIKFTRGNKDTNCISFSTNANVSLDYRNDRFVMMKVPKDDIGNLFVSGKYMLEEIDKVISAKIDELLANENGNKEILSLISQINEAESSADIKKIVSRTYKGVKNTNEKYIGASNSALTKNAVMTRFGNKQYLNERQQLEYNRLIAKLTVLETRGKLRNIIPTHLTNTGLISSVGVAFSSSEMIHYKEVPKSSLIEVSKENMEMFAILQQASNIPGVDLKELEECKRDFLFAVQSGYIYATQNNYDIAIQIDGDGQHDPAYIEKLIEPIINGEADMTIGSRFIEKKGFQTSFLRRLGINLIRFVIKLCCGVKATDTTSGFRASSKELTAYFSREYAFDYPEPEAIVAASLNGYRVKDVPVEMKEREGGKSSINAFRSIYYMIKVPVALIILRLGTRRKRKKAKEGK